MLVWPTLTVLFALGASPLTAAVDERPSAFVDLLYPAEALAARVAGVVVIGVTTDSTGRVVAAEPLSGPAVLRPAAVANVKQWRLSPRARTEPIVYRFEIDIASCNDDGHSLFRLTQPNLAVVTACTRPGRAPLPPPDDSVLIVSIGADATYPYIARNGGFTGVTVLELSIDASGAVTEARALNELGLFNDAAVAHAKTWRVRTNGPRRAIVVYEFALDNYDCHPDTRTVFWRVTTDYLRLSACRPTIQP